MPKHHPRADAFTARYPELLAEEAIGPDRAEFVTVAPGRNCPLCCGRGYHGRIAIIEALPLQGLEELIADKAPAAAFHVQLRKRGCRTLLEDGIRKAALGLTTVEEVFAAVVDSSGHHTPNATDPPFASPS